MRTSRLAKILAGLVQILIENNDRKVEGANIPHSVFVPYTNENGNLRREFLLSSSPLKGSANSSNSSFHCNFLTPPSSDARIYPNTRLGGLSSFKNPKIRRFPNRTREFHLLTLDESRMCAVYTTTPGICIHRIGYIVSHIGNPRSQPILINLKRIDLRLSKPTTSWMLQTWSEIPASIAGVTLSV
jgi:hypothetical protein